MYDSFPARKILEGIVKLPIVSYCYINEMEYRAQIQLFKLLNEILVYIVIGVRIY